ncbi:hypothetical protein LTR66_000394 [Elasticomyces elasticus]|nr:hypothetical protein LTR66_000394 [Elasticomyces elasticus]
MGKTPSHTARSSILGGGARTYQPLDRNGSTSYQPYEGGYHDRQGLVPPAAGASAKASMFYMPSSKWTWSFFGVAVVQAAIALGLEAYVFAEFRTHLEGNEWSKSGARTISTYLSLFIFGFLYQIVLVYDALRLKNTIQVIGLCIYNAGLLVYAAVQISQIHDAVVKLLNPPDGAPRGIDKDVWPVLWPFLVALPCVIALGSVLLGYVAWKLYDEFAWSIYKHISADLRMMRRYMTYQIYIALLKFDFFFFLGFTVQFLFVVNHTANVEKSLTIAAIPITIILLFMAAYWTRRESYIGMSATIVVYLGALAYFLFKLVRIHASNPNRVKDYQPARNSLTTFAAITVLLLVITIVNACWCTSNFGKGLKPHVQKRRVEDPEAKPYDQYAGNAYAAGGAYPLGPHRLAEGAGRYPREAPRRTSVSTTRARCNRLNVSKIVHTTFPTPTIPAPPPRPLSVDPEVLADDVQTTLPTTEATDVQEAVEPSSQTSETADKENTAPPHSPRPAHRLLSSISHASTLAPTTTSPGAAVTRTVIELPEGSLPPPLEMLYQSATKILQSQFATAPPHTVQRLAELVLQPRKHYRYLPSYLNALDRVVNVSSPANVFPLPQAQLATNGGFLTNGDISRGGGGVINGSSDREGGLGSDESLGGALLTPIPWLRNGHGAGAGETGAIHTAQHDGELRSESTQTIQGPRGAGSIETVSVTVNGISSASSSPSTQQGTLGDPATPPTDTSRDEQSMVHSLREQGAVTQGELLRQEQQAGVVPAAQPSPRRALLAPGAAAVGREIMAEMVETAPGRETPEEHPHARGPDVIGMEDMGPQRRELGAETGLDMERAAGRGGSPKRDVEPVDESVEMEEQAEERRESNIGAGMEDSKMDETVENEHIVGEGEATQGEAADAQQAGKETEAADAIQETDADGDFVLVDADGMMDDDDEKERPAMGDSTGT